MSAKSFRILVVCTGNTCRSPLGEGLLRFMLEKAGIEGVTVVSAGTSAAVGCPASEQAVQAAKELGVDISNHRSLPLSGEMLDKSNLILVMSESHRDWIHSVSQSARGRVFLAAGFRDSSSPVEIPDPIGCTVGVFLECAEVMQKSFRGLIAQLPQLRLQFAFDVVDFAVGTDHRGIMVKKSLLCVLDRLNLTWEDMGAFSREPADYPEFAFAVGERVVQGKARRGALLCGTGIGMSIAANKVQGIRAAVVTNARLAELSRTHNNTNVIVFCEQTTEKEIEEIIQIWWNTDFEGGRHANRVGLIMEYEKSSLFPPKTE